MQAYLSARSYFTLGEKILTTLCCSLVLSTLSGWHSAVTALSYHPRMDRATWIADSSVLQCKLIQPIPSFGQAVFDHSAGKQLRFYLQTVANPMSAGQASLKSNPPIWNRDLEPTNLGMVPVREGDFPVELDAALSTRVLTELYKGKSPGFTRRAWYVEEAYAEDEAIEVALSSVHFREAYSLYRQCLGRLLPVGFDQLARSRVHFETDKWALTAETITWLDMIARYATEDPQLDRMFVDGHTDDTHTTTYNVELSRKRAEAVVEYLVAKGVSANQITTRFHGERFPVESNKTPAGKQANRRVTIRLDRIETNFSQR